MVLRNKIIAVPTSNQFRWSMYNLGKVRMTGAELAGEYSRTVGRVSFGLAGRWSFQRASDLSDRDALTWKGQIPYIPLHSAPAGLKFGHFAGEDVYTTAESDRLVRLPMYYGLTQEERQTVVDAVRAFYA